MNVKPQPCTREQLFDSTTTIIDAIDSFRSTDAAILGTLGDGLRSLQDTLLGSGNIPSLVFYPFPELCLQLCEGFSEKLSEIHGDASRCANIAMSGYNLCQLQKALLAIFHAFATYLNLIRCSTAKLGTAARKRCMACVACAIRDLQDHLTHLEHIGKPEFVLFQYHLTKDCLLMYCEQLQDLGIESYPQTYCDCIKQGSNHVTRCQDDIVIIRVGQDAMEHFSGISVQLLENIARRKRLGDKKGYEDFSNRYEDGEERLRTVISHLRHDKVLVSFEILTRGYRLEFSDMTSEAVEQLGWS